MDTHTFRQQLAARRRELANRRRINHHTTHFGGYPRRIHDGAAPEEAEANVAADRTASLDGSVIAVTPTLVTPRQPPPPPPLPGYMSPTRCSVSRSTDDGPRQPLQYSPPRAATTCCGSPGGVRGSPGGVRGSPGGGSAAADVHRAASALDELRCVPPTRFGSGRRPACQGARRLPPALVRVHRSPWQGAACCTTLFAQGPSHPAVVTNANFETLCPHKRNLEDASFFRGVFTNVFPRLASGLSSPSPSRPSLVLVSVMTSAPSSPTGGAEDVPFLILCCFLGSSVAIVLSHFLVRRFFPAPSASTGLFSTQSAYGTQMQTQTVLDLERRVLRLEDQLRRMPGGAPSVDTVYRVRSASPNANARLADPQAQWSASPGRNGAF